MADLIDTGAAWPAGIRQIETTDPVLGGAPNIATGAGMTNIPHLQLAQRTQVLKGIIDGAGLGATAVPLVTLNSASARVTGSYRFVSGDANTPATGVAGTVQVIAASASAVNQTAWDSASSRMFTRFWNGTVWSAWAEIWRTTGTAQSLTTAGYQRLPSGLILQWVTGLTDSSGNMALAWPTTFPTAVLGGVANEASPNGWAANSVTVWAFDLAQSTVSTGFARMRNIAGASGPAVGPTINGRILAWGY